jgi:hypothetical protein
MASLGRQRIGGMAAAKYGGIRRKMAYGGEMAWQHQL